MQHGRNDINCNVLESLDLIFSSYSISVDRILEGSLIAPDMSTDGEIRSNTIINSITQEVGNSWKHFVGEFSTMLTSITHSHLMSMMMLFLKYIRFWLRTNIDFEEMN